jgi:DNA-binding GntR family transcriptional regulator
VVPSPAYQRIADDLRRQILDGTLAPGARLPSRPQLTRQYGVSDSVAVQAIRLLAAEGLAEARSGSGTYVRHRPRLQRVGRIWYTDRAAGSPFRAQVAGGTVTSSTERVPMTPAIAARLGCQAGDLAMRTRYTNSADGQPVLLSDSWEPAELTTGTPVMLPEEGPHARRGVVERMAVIGQVITRADEVISARPALADEAERLKIRPGSIVLTIARTYRTDERAVETADIVMPVERYELVYEIPVG